MNAPEYAAPVLPSVEHVPQLLSKEFNTNFAAVEEASLPQHSEALGMIKMEDFSKKVRDLELQLIDSKA